MYLSLRTGNNQSNKTITSKPIKLDKPIPKKLSFGFKGDSTKLLVVLTELHQKVELLNTEFCNPQQLANVLLAPDLKNNNLPTIHFAIETTQIRFFFDFLKIHFYNLSPSIIEQSKLFRTKQNKPLKAQNLYSSKIPSIKNEKVFVSALNKLL